VEKKAIALQENEARNCSKEGRPLSLLEQYLASPDLDRKDVIGMMVDMLLAGADTVSIFFNRCIKNALVTCSVAGFFLLEIEII